jgi:hypothetical protein
MFKKLIEDFSTSYKCVKLHKGFVRRMADSLSGEKGEKGENDLSTILLIHRFFMHAYVAFKFFVEF